MPDLALRCIESWHKFMPDYEFKLWNEDNFDIHFCQYTKEAYEAHKYAFVSDVARLFALNKEGGLYLDVDFVVYKSFDDLLQLTAFAGFEGSKTSPLMMGVVASEPSGIWVGEQLKLYSSKKFIINGQEDLTPNVRLITDNMVIDGFCPNGQEQDYKDLHVFPVEYFCPRQTTGEYFYTKNTYCEQLGESSWAKRAPTWKTKILSLFGQHNRIRIIKIKRRLFG